MPSHNRMHPTNCYSRSILAVRHRPTGNKVLRPLPKRAHQTTDIPATQPPSPPARERPPTLTHAVSSQPPSLFCVSPQKLVSRSGRNSWRLHRATWRRMTSTQRNNSRVAYMAVGQPSALGTGCHPGRSVGLPGERNLYVRHGQMWSRPHYDKLSTFRGETEQRRNCRNGGSSCTMDERRWRHDMNEWILHYNRWLTSFSLDRSVDSATPMLEATERRLSPWLIRSLASAMLVAVNTSFLSDFLLYFML